ncbi:uncharacterized protein [Drosophila kikkawai]|uniref:Uncharacterized protein n=1 Tax=Drosophila kikkawai TaxID=30033 RepID=A0A6P4IMF5_DROKI|nr:uncharacterized protein LOC108080074 [Drosophila kikkawai]
MRSLPSLLSLLGLLLVLLLGSQCSGTGKVIYFNHLNETQSARASKNQTDLLGKSMLFDTRGNRCRHGFIRDHHGRCRRLV